MSKLSIFLALALTGSIIVNFYQWHCAHSLFAPDSAPIAHAESSSPLGDLLSPVPVSREQQAASPDHSSSAGSAPADAVNTITTLLDNGDFSQAQQHLQQALRQSPDNFALMMLEARLLKHTAPLSEVVLHYYGLLDKPLNAAQLQEVTRERDVLVDDALGQLKRAGSWDTMAIFLEPLLQRDPLQEDYALWLATAYGEQARYSAMESTLAALDYDDPRAQRIRRLYRLSTPVSQPEIPDQQPTVARRGEPVSLSRQGAHFIAPVQLNRQPARLLLDTGATRTAITQKAFDKLSQQSAVRFIGNFTINTAGGPAEAALIELDQLSLGSYHMVNVRVFVLPLAQMEQADGLLGMNVLGRFAFHLDQQAGILWVSPSD